MARNMLLAFITFTFVQEISALCYFRNGTATTSDFSPCSDDASNPMSTVCCASWDQCLPNGLCQSYDDVIWRETCTKKDWDEGGCQELCSNEREAQRNDNIKVTPCDGAGNSSSLRWCCGSSDACCSDGSDLPVYTIARRFGDPIPTLSSSISSSPSASPTYSAFSTASSVFSATSSVATSAAAATASSGTHGLSTGAKAGIGVGAAVGAMALVALGFFIYKALQWRQDAKAAAPPYSNPEEYHLQGLVETYRYQQELKPAQLAGVETAVHEMPGSRDTSEMCVASPPVAVTGVARDSNLSTL